MGAVLHEDMLCLQFGERLLCQVLEITDNNNSLENKEATWIIDQVIGLKLISIAWWHAISLVWGRSYFAWLFYPFPLIFIFLLQIVFIKKEENDWSISCKWLIGFSRNFYERSIISRWTNLLIFSSTQFKVFEKYSIITSIRFYLYWDQCIRLLWFWVWNSGIVNIFLQSFTNT